MPHESSQRVDLAFSGCCPLLPVVSLGLSGACCYSRVYLPKPEKIPCNVAERERGETRQGWALRVLSASALGLHVVQLLLPHWLLSLSMVHILVVLVACWVVAFPLRCAGSYVPGLHAHTHPLEVFGGGRWGGISILECRCPAHLSEC